MLCFATVMDHFWCAEPVSNLVPRHTSPCHLHNIVQYGSKAHVRQKFVHPHFTPGSKDNLSRSTLKVHTTTFQSFSWTHSPKKFFPWTFSHLLLYHPSSLPAVYSLPLYSHCQCHSLLRNLFYICIKFNNKSMILARCTGGVMWWFHCRACAHLRCLSSIVVAPLSLSGALLLVWDHGSVLWPSSYLKNALDWLWYWGHQEVCKSFYIQNNTNSTML